MLVGRTGSFGAREMQEQRPVEVTSQEGFASSGNIPCRMVDQGVLTHQTRYLSILVHCVTDEKRQTSSLKPQRIELLSRDI